MPSSVGIAASAGTASSADGIPAARAGSSERAPGEGLGGGAGSSGRSEGAGGAGSGMSGSGTGMGPAGGGREARGEESSATLKTPPAALDAVAYLGSFADAPVYPDIDMYVLYAPDKRNGISVPGPDVCLEGEQLRSKERFTFAETITDYSKCRPRNPGGEPEGVFCPPEAETRIVHSNQHLFSPVSYAVNRCLEYDKSHCYMRDLGDKELEVCRVDFAYEGIWAEGTVFAYKCANSASRTYRNNLRYDIRWKMDIYDLESPRVRRTRQVYKETRTVSRCN